MTDATRAIEEAKAVKEQIEFHRNAMHLFAEARSSAIRRAMAAGMSAASIAQELGVSRQQVYVLAYQENKA